MARKPDEPSSIGSSIIPIVNTLQDIFAQISTGAPVELPAVAVVGSQSSGKSSVLEALVGRDFLPRGTGICTRRPLLLQLVQQQSRRDEDGDEEEEREGGEWGEFRHLPGKRFRDFGAIRNEIIAETERGAGQNKGVSDKEIRLKISSPNVLNITLVDLPGITKVPMGDQPRDIEARIRCMIMSYIKKEACIILAVTPANADLATSDALQMAKEADPSGIRTIGVITKLDIMDKGTNALNFLLGKVIPLRLGYVGVINRGQEDINKNRSIKEALSREEKFFRGNSIYNGVSQHCGIPKLAKKLNQILEQHIQTVLPKLKSELKTQLLSAVKELRSYGDAIESKTERGGILLDILRRHSEAFTAMVEGKCQEMSTKELSGGARIHYIFQSIFVKSLEKVDPCEDATDEDIRTAIQNASGPRNALFVPEVPFEVLVRKQVARLLDPSVECLRLVYDELIKIVRDCESNEIKRFPVLQKRLNEVIGGFLDDGIKSAEKMIENIIEMEMDYINTSNPNFIGGYKAVEMAMQQVKSLQNDIDQASTIGKGPNYGGAIPSTVSNGILPNQGYQTLPHNGRPTVVSSSAGNSIPSRTWGLSSRFGTRDSHVKSAADKSLDGSSRDIDQTPSVIHLLGAAKSPRTWGLPSIFGTRDSRDLHDSHVESAVDKSLNGSSHDIDQTSSVIHLLELPASLRPPDIQADNEVVEVMIVKLLLRSYYDIVRSNIEDLVPKAIMHFLVNDTKRGLLRIFIQKLYRENLFDEMLKEEGETVEKRKQANELLQILQQATQTLDEIEAEVCSRSSRSSTDY